MKITEEMIEKAEQAIADIPAAGGMVMELYRTTLAQKLSRDLIKEIARVSLSAALAD